MTLNKTIFWLLAPPLIAMLTLMFGCSMIGHRPPPADWPKLAITVHNVSHKEMRDVCQKYMPFSMIAEACAEWSFDKMTCDIWHAGASKPEIEHEMDHCHGYDHLGFTTLADAWEEWKKGRK